jgi:hypothetical protein
MLKNGRLDIVATCMLLAGSSFSLWAQQLPATAPTGIIAAAGADAAVPLVAPSDRRPNPPRVKCAGDELTIEADNSLLSSVLDAVHACIGAKIAMPEGAVDGPVFFQLGPGRTRDVLNSFLSETDMDFVVLLSSTAPEKVVSVELIARTLDVRGANAPIVAANGPMTPARLAWMAARSLGRGLPPSEELTVGQPSNDRGAAGSASADHADASPAVSTSPAPETRQVASALDASTSTMAAAVEANPVTSTAASDASGLMNTGASDNTASGGRESITATAESPAAAALAESGAVAPADLELKHKITDMQQLFEQRKKMNSAPATTSDSNAAPSPR